MIWYYEKVMFDFNLVLSTSLSFKFSLSLLISIIKLWPSCFESDFDFISVELFLVDSNASIKNYHVNELCVQIVYFCL